MEQKQIEATLDNKGNAKTLIAITLPATAPTKTVVWKERIQYVRAPPSTQSLYSY